MSQIPESELILNKDGSVYHLNLLPHELAPVVINVGDPDRVPMVSAYFDSVTVRKQKREFVSHTGLYKGKPMTVLSTGIGTDNIDIVYNELDALVNIDLGKRTINSSLDSLFLVRIGTSGSLQKDIPVDSFVCSSFGLGLDGLLNFYTLDNDEEETRIISAFREHYPNHGILPQSYISRASAQLTGHLSPGMFTGITASCSGFYGPQMRQLRLKPSRPDMIERLSSFSLGGHRITNFEMETSAIYGMGKVMGHACLSLSAIVANRVNRTFSKRPAETMEKLILTTLENLSTLPG